LSAEWITAIASIIAAFSIVIIWKQLRNDHERSRREKAIELIDIFTGRMNEISPGIRFARKLIEKLTESQCRNLWRLEAFKIDIEHKHLVIGSLQEQIKSLQLKEINGQILLDQEQLSILRSMIASYLNVLETICAAWHYSVADREIIEEEFSSLIMPDPDYFPLAKIREATGKYPSLHVFTEAIKRKKKLPGKKKIA
jgi:hypothetical protein